MFAAHRYQRGGASAPRLVGPDGRELRRPWRMTTPQVAVRVRQLRAARRQPIWPRLLGVLLLGVAGVAALHPVDPVPRHVAASASARTGPGLAQLQLVAPAGDLSAPPDRFVWRGDGAAAVRTLVLCDASYAEIARVDGIAGADWSLTPEVAALLADGGTFHWFVEAGAAASLARSRLESFTIR